jgi:hypothetical protein
LKPGGFWRYEATAFNLYSPTDVHHPHQDADHSDDLGEEGAELVQLALGVARYKLNLKKQRLETRFSLHGFKG